ncbi:MAG: hypothetical protein KDC92_11165, partial [Bacteroidetes bacterium]|nr:hypothetical protein [Bacteroidota bacterium]
FPIIRESYGSIRIKDQLSQNADIARKSIGHSINMIIVILGFIITLFAYIALHKTGFALVVIPLGAIAILVLLILNFKVSVLNKKFQHIFKQETACWQIRTRANKLLQEFDFEQIIGIRMHERRLFVLTRSEERYCVVNAHGSTLRSYEIESLGNAIADFIGVKFINTGATMHNDGESINKYKIMSKSIETIERILDWFA